MKTTTSSVPWVAAAAALALLACRSAEAPSPESVKPGINEPYLEEEIAVEDWIGRFEREGRSVYDARREIMAAAHVPAGAAVADVGAGTGLFVPLLAAEVGPAGKVIAVDIVEEFLEHIQERSAAAGLRNVETVLCTDRSVGLPAESIDVAFLCDVYHHLEYPAESLASIHRALRPGATLVLVEFERVPGESSEWVLEHVRGGKEVFVEEVRSAGFELLDEADLMADTYFLRFRKVARD